MRFRSLELAAYGPFTDRRLDLSGGKAGLHVVFGPNEAGKSSALRAVSDLLFGIPERTADAFVHPYDQLRLGGTLERAGGERLAFLRRKGKGKKGTLLAADGITLLADDALTPYLNGVEREIFAARFGISHRTLVAGGRELLEQQGDVGQALFTAGLGGRRLLPVVRELEGEAEKLFLARASKPEINRLLAELDGARAEQKGATLLAGRFEAERRALEALLAEEGEVRRQLAEARAEAARLARIRRALPRLAERAKHAAEIADLGPGRLLSEDFAERRRQAAEALREAELRGARAAEERDGLAQEIGRLAALPLLLERAEAIEALGQEWAVVKRGREERQRLAAARAEHLATAEEHLAEIRPDLTLAEAPMLRRALDLWQRAQELGNRHQAIREAVDVARRQGVALGERRERLEREAAALPPQRELGALRRAVEAARRAGDLDAALAERERAAAAEGAKLAAEVKRLGLWSGSWEALEGLPLPGAETRERFAAAWSELEERRRRAVALGEQAAATLADTTVALEEMQRTGAVPSEGELAAARARRGGLWAPLRSRLDGGAGQPSPEPESLAAYEASVDAADELADRLRREAERVHQQAHLLARRSALERQVGQAAADAAAATAESAALAAAWAELWAAAAVTPRPPREMAAWVATAERLRDRAAALVQLGREAGQARTARRHRREALAAVLAGALPPGDELAPALVAAEESLVRGDEVERRREATERDRADLDAAQIRQRGELAAAERAQALWQEGWAEVMGEVGLPPTAFPADSSQRFDRLRGLFQSLKEAEGHARRGERLDEQAAAFAATLAAEVRLAAPDLGGQPPELAVAALGTRLVGARLDEAKREVLAGRREKAEADLARAQETALVMRGRLGALREEAGAAGDEEVAAAEERSARLRHLEAERARVERQLLEDGEGASLAELEREAAAVDAGAWPGGLAGRLAELAANVEELAQRSGDLREKIGEARRALAQMDGGGAAAEAGQRAEEILAGLGGKVRRYVRLKLASALLSREIERYRREHQDPVLTRAGELFTRLTLGSFAGLSTGWNERDEPILEALRPDGRRLRVEAMSEGSRDQLYLSLRLATLERAAEDAEPMPFWVDDILIHFDDPRSAATLEALADLARTTQVILFTHHGRLAEMARELAARRPDEVFVLEL